MAGRRQGNATAARRRPARAGGRAVRLAAPLLAVGLAGAALASCSKEQDPGPSLTAPPTPPAHRLVGAVLPARAADYTVLGDFPVSGQAEATYVSSADALALAVVTLTSDQSFGQTTFEADAWYEASYCGLFNADAAEGERQAGCVAPLVDGFLTVVGSFVQTPAELSQLANAIYETLP